MGKTQKSGASSKTERGGQSEKGEVAEELLQLTVHEASLDSAESSDPTKILMAIQTMSKTMTDRFDALEATLASTQALLSSLGNRVTEVEDATSNLDVRLSRLEGICTDLSAANEKLRSKVVDLEARSRRQNIKIVGMPEKIENGRPCEFLTKFFPELLGAQHFLKPITVDRAHRLGSLPSDEVERARARPRVMIARIHHYQTKEKILQLARQQFPLSYRDNAIHIFPDLSVEVMKKREAFEDARKKLRGAGARVGFRYPARLRVTLNGKETICATPQEALALVETLPSA